ncbi:MAG: DUF3127 domain-containing protein [Bacteroidia bacterium]|nr:DUF3127 domain-containing protein [Bacteroidia bacterium]NNJ55677.1 DUF3127 domain-containing protein [Bacteroidia bacterium]
MENIVLEGKLVQVLPLQEGVSTRGAWKKQDFVIETTEQYPKKVCISCWNEKADELGNYQPNDLMKVAVNIESREYNSRWYTDIKAWRIEGGTSSGGQTPPTAETSSKEDVVGMSFSDEDDELPF